MNLVEIFPPALPLDGADTVGVWFMTPLIVAAVAFSLATLALAFFAALSFRRSAPTPRYRRATHAANGVESLPQIDSAPFPNLLRK